MKTICILLLTAVLVCIGIGCNSNEANGDIITEATTIPTTTTISETTTAVSTTTIPETIVTTTAKVATTTTVPIVTIPVTTTATKPRNIKRTNGELTGEDFIQFYHSNKAVLNRIKDNLVSSEYSYIHIMYDYFDNKVIVGGGGDEKGKAKSVKPIESDVAYYFSLVEEDLISKITWNRGSLDGYGKVEFTFIYNSEPLVDAICGLAYVVDLGDLVEPGFYKHIEDNWYWHKRHHSVLETGEETEEIE